MPRRYFFSEVIPDLWPIHYEVSLVDQSPTRYDGLSPEAFYEKYRGHRDKSVAVFGPPGYLPAVVPIFKITHIDT